MDQDAARLLFSLDAALARWLAAARMRLGQIQMETLPPPQAGFRLRHHDDAGRPHEELALFTGGADDAVELARYDDAGNYRPLKTAPNLRHGWRLEALPDLPALRRALDAFYPARLGALLAFENGRLPVTPLRETLARQTGMYRITQKLTDAQADALVGRFCRSDGGCLRTILWRRDLAGTPASSHLPPEKFEPAFDQTGHGETRSLPLLCQEACNLLVAEARAVIKGERTAAAASAVDC
ncbi:MAG: hypothetical protein JO295_12945 [Verrucomicrobia bacterium]|nr:hypothetical protein [Verrucomicrobiota bacterium]